MHNPAEAASQSKQYRQSQHPEALKAKRANIIKVLQSRYGDVEEDEDFDEVLHQLSGDYTISEQDDHSASICRFQVKSQQQTIPAEIHNPSPAPTTEALKAVIHPVKFPDISTMQLWTPTVLENTPVAPVTSAHMAVTQITTQVDHRRDLADTGASVCATGRKEILHDFTARTQYEITGYDGNITKAAGQGIAHIQNIHTGVIDKMLFVYIPAIEGTIISLEHHARTHPAIHRWTQEAIPATNSGQVTFYAEDNSVVSMYKTIQDKGLYYIQNLDFIQATNQQQNGQQITVTRVMEKVTTTTWTEHDQTDMDELTTRTGSLTPYCDDFDPTLELEHFPSLLQSNKRIYASIKTTLVTPQILPMNDLTKDVMVFETWHQRLAHCSEKRLRQTQKLVDGIPPLRKAPIPHIVACRTCDIAKLKKAPRGQITDTPDIVDIGQIFQMDIGFIRGPANLAAVVAREEESQMKVIESRQRYTCYLLIVDYKSRYAWIFPLKTKSVPRALIRNFLTNHGSTKTHNRRIRTDGEGSLAESQQFRTMVIGLEWTLEKTAPDTSSQNGIAECPHQTLATMIRCVLYSSSLPITFWADALIYVNYVNNRLYHSGIEGIPYTRWTSKRPDLRHLRAFGAHVSVRRTGHRPTKADPHYYSGRFLRFGATEKNLIYLDTHTLREKTARHCTVDG